MIACEVMFVGQRAGGSQGSSVWLVQLVLHRLCSNEQTLFHPFSLVGCQGCCKLSFPSFPVCKVLARVLEGCAEFFAMSKNNPEHAVHPEWDTKCTKQPQEYEILEAGQGRKEGNSLIPGSQLG